jgi:hypothetical protein
MRKLLWFTGLYGASLAVFALAALALRSLFR